MSILTLIFIGVFNDHFTKTGRTIVDLENDNHGRFIVTVEDNRRNIIRYCFITRDDYNVFRTGSTLGIYKDENDESVSESTPTDLVTVYLRNGAKKLLPRGSTVLDLAFSIHESIGFSAKSATINGQPASIYNILHDRNKVIIETSPPEVGNRARIDWLTNVKTDSAKKKIQKYLESKYEGDNPRFESKSKVTDANFNTVLNELMSNSILAEIVEEDN